MKLIAQIEEKSSVIGRFYPEQDNLGRTFANICMPVVVRRSRRITKDTSSRHIMRPVPVFILKTHNQTNYKCLHKFVQADNATAI